MRLLANRKIKLYSLIIIFAFCVILIPASAYAALTIEPIYSVLKNTDTGTGAQIKLIWEKIITYVNFLIIALLIFVAFAQILRINVNTYGIKKILPALLLAIIAANFSFLFCRLLVDLANIVMSLFIEKQVDNTTLSAGFSGDWSNPSKWSPPLNRSGVGNILWFMVAQLFVIVGAILVLVLAYLFFIRIWMIYFLVVLAPLAFMATVLPATKSVFTQWWSNFAKWVFLPVVSIFWIWLGNQWAGSVAGDPMMSYVFAGICYYLAITTPFKMGGVVMQAWGRLPGGAAKGAVNSWAGRKIKEKWVDPLIDDYKRRAGNWYASKASSTPDIRAKERDAIRAAELRGASAEEIKRIQDKANNDVNRATKWYANPLGTIRRRSLKVAHDREQRKREELGWIDQGTREALGGKEGEYLNKKQRLKRGEWMENINTLYGEKDWAEKQLQLEYFESQVASNKVKYKGLAEKAGKEAEEAKSTKDTTLARARAKGWSEDKIAKLSERIDLGIEGKELKAKLYGEGFSDAALNSAQYAMRVKATDQKTTNIKNLAVAMAHRADPNFMSNAQWAKVYHNLADAMLYSRVTERTASKAVSDFEREAQGVPFKLNIEVEGFKRAVATFEAATKKLEQAEKDGASEEVRNELKVQIENAEEMRKKSKTGYEEQIKAIKATKRYYDANTGQLKGIAKANLSDMILDRNGKIIEDVSKARSINEINGIPEAIAGLFRDRTAKTISDIVKDEIASEKEKRTFIESARLLRDELSKEFKLVAAGRANELSMEKYWKVTAAVNNALSVNETSADYAKIQEILNDLHADNAKEGDIHARNDMARENQFALGSFINNTPEAIKVTNTAIAKFLQEKTSFAGNFAGIKEGDLANSYLEFRKDSTPEVIAEVDKLLKEDQIFQDEYLKDAVVSHLSRNTKISADQLKHWSKVYLGDNNRVDFDLTGGTTPGADPAVKAEYEKNIGFLRSIQQVVDEASIRGTGEFLKKGARAARQTSFLTASLNRQAGKSMDMSRGMDGQKARISDDRYNIGDLGYDPAALKGYFGEERYRSEFENT